MTDREKLIELIGGTYYGRDNNSLVGKNFQQEFIAKIADHLIANGVVVREWISVKDRLPKDGEIVTICTEKGFVYAGDLIGDTWFLDNDSWTANVTHWMPLPEPPADMRKGENG